MQREVAWRVFAKEYNDSDFQFSEGGERSPSYVITPLGAKINRLFVVGVITDIDNVGSDEQPMWRARLSDPTGVYVLSAGLYQPEAARALSGIDPPTFAAVMGKTRVYSPEDGTLYLSVRPEMVRVVDAAVRDYWTLECCRSLKVRLDAVSEALKMDPLTKEELFALGYRERLADGVVRALRHYGNVDLERYRLMLADSLRYLLPESQLAPPEEKEEEESDLDDYVLDLIEKLDTDGKGADWEALLEASEKDGVEKDDLEGSVNSVLDKGLAYEPVIGKLKRI
ncbi:MAG: RPA family protein [Thermoplasmata archaeon]